MTGDVFIDTNIFVYAHDQSAASKQERAVETLDHLAARGVGTVLSEDFSEGRIIDGVTFRNPFARGFALPSLR
jgi:predicted nucleic acid-binding protein